MERAENVEPITFCDRPPIDGVTTYLKLYNVTFARACSGRNFATHGSPEVIEVIGRHGQAGGTPQALTRFKAKVRELTRRTRGRSLEQIVKELSVYLIGWRGYFGFCQTPSVLRSLDEWLRRRLRAIAWKQWKRGRTRFAELRRRGVGREMAATTAGSPHGPWRLAASPALHIGMPTITFSSLGLPSLVAKRHA